MNPLEQLVQTIRAQCTIDLAVPIEIREIDGHKVFVFDNGELAACYARNISLDFVDKLVPLSPRRMVFRDDGFADDATKINTEQIFKQQRPSTDVWSF